MIEKKDWDNVLEQLETQKKNAEIAIEQDNVLIELCKGKIKDFPEDKDPMPEEAKEALEAVK